jgi:hypothetical protein
METALMSNFGRKAATAAVAFATVGSTLFGGVALANDGKNGHNDIRNTGGAGGNGTATNNCLNIGIPILSGLALGGTASATGASCTATATGGAGGVGADVD